MKSLNNTIHVEELLARLRTITPENERLWGSLTAHQMICHLGDSFKAAMGEKRISSRNNLFTRTVLRWLAFHIPVRWPRGFKTLPEIDQHKGGTRPCRFGRDLYEMMHLLDEFSREERAFEWQVHPVFGRLSEREWLRWGYLHCDHHLRQFGA